MQSNKSPIERACDSVGSQAVMARILGVTPAMVNQLVKGLRPVPIEHCLTIETATKGVVTRQELRPNDFWKIWPDLAYLSPTHDIAAINLDATDQERREVDRREESPSSTGKVVA